MHIDDFQHLPELEEAEPQQQIARKCVEGDEQQDEFEVGHSGSQEYTPEAVFKDGVRAAFNQWRVEKMNNRSLNAFFHWLQAGHSKSLSCFLSLLISASFLCFIASKVMAFM